MRAIRVDAFAFSHVDFNLPHPIVSDIKVRRALAYATNRKEIIDKVAHGSAIAAETDQQPKYSWAYTADIAHYPYDPAKARGALDADGWKVGPDGIRVKNGQRLEFTLSTQTESINGKANQTIVQRAWRDVGVQADIKNYPTSQFFDNSTKGILQGGHYDVALFCWVGGGRSRRQRHLLGRQPGAARSKRDVLEQPCGDRCHERRTQDDRLAAAQARLLHRAEQLAIDVPTIILYFRRSRYVYNTD